uniref:protein-serine/threonine phosphatase n=1 Tax=Kalanchoe fedtschenkoi TaxID=63787 RepID=A0A7N0TDU8_KALFE
MLSSYYGKDADDFLLKSSASSRRRRRLLIRRLKLLIKPNTCAAGSRRETEPSDASGAPGKGAAKMEGGKPQPSSSSSSRPTTFRRLDGDINRPAGIPLTGEDIVGPDNKARGVNCASHGSISVIGRRRVMEDRLTVTPIDFPQSHDFFGVFDGHGGVTVSSACRDRLHRFVGELIEGVEGVDWDRVMKECFLKMDDHVNAECGGGGVGFVGECTASLLAAKVRTVGSTALVVVLGKEEIVVANCGDSRAILFRNGAVVPLSWDQKPDRSDERLRVEAAGGKVIDVNGLRVLGVLKATRSIGDYALKPYMISEPEVTVTKFSELDNFIVIASDGLWDVVSSEDACEVVKKCLNGQTRRSLGGGTTKSPADAAAMLAELAMAKGSKDNISVIVVDLKKEIPTL